MSTPTTRIQDRAYASISLDAEEPETGAYVHPNGCGTEGEAALKVDIGKRGSDQSWHKSWNKSLERSTPAPLKIEAAPMTWHSTDIYRPRGSCRRASALGLLSILVLLIVTASYLHASSSPQLQPTVLILLVCSPRFGSSLVESLIGESPEVLELQEMFNTQHGFAHSPLRNAAFDYFGERLMGKKPKTPQERDELFMHQVALLVEQNLSRAVAVASDMARAFHKGVVTFKIFDVPKPPADASVPPTSLAGLFRSYSQNSVSLLLERNAFAAFISMAKILDKCSTFQFKDSTSCKVSRPTSSYAGALQKHMVTQCAHRAWVGVSPFASYPGVRVAVLRYEDLDRLPSATQQLNFVKACIHRASPAALKPYITRGTTARSYHQQDKDHKLASSISNFAEVRSWWTAEARRQLCANVSRICISSVVRPLLEHGQINPLSIRQQVGRSPSEQVQFSHLQAWCQSSTMLDII